VFADTSVSVDEVNCPRFLLCVYTNNNNLNDYRMNNHRLIFSSLMLLLICSSFVSCSKDNDDEQSSVYAEFSSLFQKTDYYVNRLGSYSSGGVNSSDSSDGKYTVSIIGRLIVVKKKYSSGASYSKVKEALEYHYKGNPKVNEVFLNNAGTVTIDCRN
jgi:hypothetical protein